MRNKSIRFLGAMWNETIKRIPYILIILTFIAVFTAYQSYRKTAETVEISKQNTQDIKTLLTRQSTILDAIKQVTTDNNITAKQQTDIIICMLQVPVEERTTDTVTGCRSKVTTSTYTPPDTSVPAPTPTPLPKDKNNNKKP